MLPIFSRKRPRNAVLGASASRVTLAGGLLALCGASFFLGRVMFPLHSEVVVPPVGSTSAAGDVCSWPADFRPLPLQEFLDVDLMTFEHPLLPRDAAPVRVHVTKRPGASYGPHREFWSTVAEGEWEKTTFRVLRAALSNTPVNKKSYLDVGAWVGPTTLFAAHFVTRVIAMEPDPRAFAELLSNVRLNPSLAARIEPYRHCVSSVSGPVTMTGPAPLGSSMSRVGGAARIPESAAKEDNWGERMVSWPATCSAPADMAARIGLLPDSLALIKLDVEGAEGVILPALVDWLASAGAEKPPIFVELHVEFWAEQKADALVKALSAYKHAWAKRAERPGHKQGDPVLSNFDPTALYRETGNPCPDKLTFCMVLVADSLHDWMQGIVMDSEV